MVIPRAWIREKKWYSISEDSPQGECDKMAEKMMLMFTIGRSSTPSSLPALVQAVLPARSLAVPPARAIPLPARVLLVAHKTLVIVGQTSAKFTSPSPPWRLMEDLPAVLPARAPAMLLALAACFIAHVAMRCYPPTFHVFEQMNRYVISECCL